VVTTKHNRPAAIPNREREVLIRPSALSGIVLPLVCLNHLGAKVEHAFPTCDLYL